MGCNGSEACFLDFFDGLEGGYPRGTAVEILRQGGAQATVPASKWGVSGEKRRIKKIISAVKYHVKKAEKYRWLRQDKNCVKAFLRCTVLWAVSWCGLRRSFLLDGDQFRGHRRGPGAFGCNWPAARGGLLLPGGVAANVVSYNSVIGAKVW